MKAKDKLTKQERLRWYKYHKCGGTNLNRCKVNPVGMGGGLEHELAKMRKYFELRLEGHKVILEAVENKTGLRRDLIDLTDGQIYEFETDTKRGQRHGKHINVIYIENMEVK